MLLKYKSLFYSVIIASSILVITACQQKETPNKTLHVLAVESFLADIAQNIAGNRLTIDVLMPRGTDPHSFEPTPQDVSRVADCDVLIINGAGFEGFLSRLLQNSGGKQFVIEASAGLLSRTMIHAESSPSGNSDDHEIDSHFWLDPSLTIRYVENIRDGFIQADSAGVDTYTQRAQDYISQLIELDNWIKTQVAQIPEERRLLVTNHESFGYYAERYGFRILGAIIPSVSTNASPSAQQLGELIDQIKAYGAPAIFIETGANPQIAQQIASETGVKVITDLYTHSVSEPDGPAPTYIDFMRYNTNKIVEALMEGSNQP